MKLNFQIFLFAILFSLMPVLIETAKEFHDVGAAKLMAYQWGDWLILGVSCAALMVTNLVSFFSTKWSDHQQAKKDNGTKPPFPI